MSDQIIYEDSQIRIVELLGTGDKERLETMLTLYSWLFPEYAHYTVRMRRRASLPQVTRPGHIAHYWLIEAGSKSAGLCTFRYIQRRNCGIGVAFGLNPATRAIVVREERLSKFVISMIMEQLAKDCSVMGSPDYLGLVTEVEHRKLMDHYVQLGMYELPISYFEPIFPVEKHHEPGIPCRPSKYEPVFLGMTPNPVIGYKKYRCEELADFALAFLVDHYGLQSDHETVRTVLKSIPGC